MPGRGRVAAAPAPDLAVDLPSDYDPDAAPAGSCPFWSTKSACRRRCHSVSFPGDVRLAAPLPALIERPTARGDRLWSRALGLSRRASPGSLAETGLTFAWQRRARLLSAVPLLGGRP
jgi:hypothetical protein